MPGDAGSARARKHPVTSGAKSRSSSIVSSTDGVAPSSTISNVASPISTTSRFVIELTFCLAVIRVNLK